MICPILQLIIDMYCMSLIFGDVFLQLRVAWELISWLMLAIRHQRMVNSSVATMISPADQDAIVHQWGYPLVN